MEIEFKFENPTHNWSILFVFKKYYEDFIQNNPSIKTTYINSGLFEDRSPCGVNSAHVLTIKNKNNGKYLLVSYWDRSEDFFLEQNGWDVDNCVEVITSSGVKPEHKVTPFSYLPYTKQFDKLSLNAKQMSDKHENKLFFRGYLYGERLSLKETGLIEITDKKIFPYQSYFEELTNNKVCLSLNGAGEICNRDLEILSARSVLLRPKLFGKFHNDFRDGYHYISFEESSNPKIQSQIIIDKFNEISNDDELLSTVSENGYKWFQENGTINSNVELLKKIIDIKKLI